MLWEGIKKRQSRKEIGYFLCAVIILALGVVFEIYHSVFPVPDAISLAALQMQAGIFTLTIALIALLAGRISDRYFGVAFNDFVFNIKPCWLTQKAVIGWELILLILGVLLQIFSWNDLVIAVFLVSCLIVWYSVSEVYGAFAGSHQASEEIIAYLNDQFQKDRGCADLFIAFCSQWRDELPAQTNLQFDQYHAVFLNAFKTMVQKDESRKVLLDQCTVLAEVMLREKKTVERGVKFVPECYFLVQEYVLKGLDDCKANDAGSRSLSESIVSFCLLHNIYQDFRDVISQMQVSDVERLFDWDAFTETIAFVDSYLGYTGDGDKAKADLNSDIRFGNFLGSYIAGIYDIKVRQSRNVFIWGVPISRLHRRNFAWLLMHKKKLSEEDKNIEAVIADRNFCYMLSQLMTNDVSLIKEFFYRKALADVDHIAQSFAMMVLKFHCYVYYLAEYEAEDCVGKEIKDAARKLIFDPAVIQAFSMFVIEIASHDKNITSFSLSDLDIFNEHLFQALNDSLDVFEEMPADGAKFSIMSMVTDNFAVLTALYLANHFGKPDILDHVIAEENASVLYSRFVSPNDNKDLIWKFYRLMGVTAKCLRDSVDASYAILESCIIQKNKSYVIHRAHQSEKLMDKNPDQQKEMIARKIRDYFQKQFGSLIGPADGDNLEISLLKITAPSDFELSKIIDGLYQNLYKIFVHHIYVYLVKNHKLSVRKKTDFLTDDDLLKYIKNHRDDVFVGSEYMLRPREFRKVEEFKNELLKTEHYTDGAYGVLQVLKKNSLRIEIVKMNMKVRAPHIDEIETKHNKDTGMLSYAVNDQMTLDFSEDELNDYLKNASRIVNIGLTVKVHTVDGVIGDVIEK